MRVTHMLDGSTSPNATWRSSRLAQSEGLVLPGSLPSPPAPVAPGSPAGAPRAPPRRTRDALAAGVVEAPEVRRHAAAAVVRAAVDPSGRLGGRAGERGADLRGELRQPGASAAALHDGLGERLVVRD